MAFDFRLNVLQLFRRLGIQTGAQLPQLDENVQMVMLLSDFSKLVPAPVEPRGMAGVNLNPAAGVTSTIQLRSLAPGGIFIETIIFRADGFNATENMFATVTTGDLALAAGDQINIGGTPTLSEFTAENQVLVGPLGVSLPAAGASNSVNLPAGIFVPNQSFFTMTTRTFNERMDIMLIWRELPAVEEVG